MENLTLIDRVAGPVVDLNEDPPTIQLGGEKTMPKRSEEVAYTYSAATVLVPVY